MFSYISFFASSFFFLPCHELSDQLRIRCVLAIYQQNPGLRSFSHIGKDTAGACSDNGISKQKIRPKAFILFPTIRAHWKSEAWQQSVSGNESNSVIPKHRWQSSPLPSRAWLSGRTLWYSFHGTTINFNPFIVKWIELIGQSGRKSPEHLKKTVLH